MGRINLNFSSVWLNALQASVMVFLMTAGSSLMAVEKKSNLPSYRFDGKKVFGDEGNEGDLQRLKVALGEVDKDVTQLRKDFDKNSAQLFHKTQNQSNLRIDLTHQTEGLIFRNIEVSLDDYVVYRSPGNVNEKIGELPFFEGPVPSGSHKLVFHAQAFLANQNPLDQPLAFELKGNYEMTVEPSKGQHVRIAVNNGDSTPQLSFRQLE